MSRLIERLGPLVLAFATRGPYICPVVFCDYFERNGPQVSVVKGIKEKCSADLKLSINILFCNRRESN